MGVGHRRGPLFKRREQDRAGPVVYRVQAGQVSGPARLQDGRAFRAFRGILGQVPDRECPGAEPVRVPRRAVTQRSAGDLDAEPGSPGPDAGITDLERALRQAQVAHAVLGAELGPILDPGQVNQELPPAVRFQVLVLAVAELARPRIRNDRNPDLLNRRSEARRDGGLLHLVEDAAAPR